MLGKISRIELLKKIALERGGKCLSNEYINGKIKITFECKEGHIWEALPNNIIKGHWCKNCGNKAQGKKKAKSIESVLEIVESKNGKCLSKEYKNNRTKLIFECNKGHIWEAVPSSITRGSWCPTCKGKNKNFNFEKLKNIISEKNGLLLTKIYVSAKVKIQIKCLNGHIWISSYDSIVRGSWCPICNNVKRGIPEEGITIDLLQNLAKEKNGKLISNTYQNSKSLLKWKCEFGHKWESRYDHIKNGSWCPICSSGISERATRMMLEHLTQKSFPKKRPIWLKNEDGKRLELDGYNDEINIAFEYQGVQHFQFIKYFHSTRTKFLKRQNDDTVKKSLCSKMGVHLIEVKYDLNFEEVFNYLVKSLNIISNELIVNKERFDFNRIKSNNSIELEVLQKIAKARGGLCLEETYLSSTVKMKWICKEGHNWEAVSSSIKNGTWCPICGNKSIGKKLAKYSINHFSKIAIERGGELINGDYKNVKSRMTFRCALGHEWNTQASSILAGHWCPKCGKIKIANEYKFKFSEVYSLIKRKGGELISKEYINAATPIKIKCQNGHIWDVRLNSIQRGTWCPKCAMKKRLSL